MKRIVFSLCICAVLTAWTADLAFEDFSKFEGWQGQSSAKFKQVEGPEGSKAISITQPGMVTKIYRYNWRDRNDWNGRFKGLSFKIKGDGSDNWGSISIGNRSFIYSYYFSLKNTDWQQYVVDWSDFTPSNTHLVQMINAPGFFGVRGINTLRFGDRWSITHNNSKLQPFTYEVADVKLVENAVPELESGKYRPLAFKEVIKKFKDGSPVTIICFGDSITAGTSLKDRDNERYAVLLNRTLREHFKRDNINAFSLAVGGAHLFDTINWINRDFQTIPDLITLMIGYNNKSGLQHQDIFRKQLEMWIDRVAAKTQGKTAILLIPTIPGNDFRFDMQDDYAAIVREVAKERNLSICPVDQEFKKLGLEKYAELMADTAHPNAAGHIMFARVIADYLIDTCK